MNKDLQIAKKTIQTEIQALKKLSASFEQSSQFSKAVNLVSKIKGKCLVVGVGKSYLVGLKISATLSSLGTPSIAFSANDLQHGSLGAIQKNSDVIYLHKIKESLYKMLVRENRLELYDNCIQFLKTRIKLDQSGFKEDIFEH